MELIVFLQDCVVEIRKKPQTVPKMANAGPRLCYRSPDFGDEATTPTCAVCCSSSANVAECSLAAILPQSTGPDAVEKILAWQNHEKRPAPATPEGRADGVRWMLELNPDHSALLSLCPACLALLARIDQQESDLMQSLKEFWRILDAFGDKFRGGERNGGHRQSSESVTSYNEYINYSKYL
jgi:hypothetical protein